MTMVRGTLDLSTKKIYTYKKHMDAVGQETNLQL